MLKTVVLLFLPISCLPSPIPPEQRQEKTGLSDIYGSTGCDHLLYFGDPDGYSIEVCVIDDVGIDVDHNDEYVLSATREELCEYVCPSDVDLDCLSPPQYWVWGGRSYALCRGNNESFDTELMLWYDSDPWALSDGRRLSLCD